MSQAVADISARFEGHPFVDNFDCFAAYLSAAKNRSKLAVQARLAGRATEADHHREMATSYMRMVRDFHNRIDWSDE